MSGSGGFFVAPASSFEAGIPVPEPTRSYFRTNTVNPIFVTSSSSFVTLVLTPGPQIFGGDAEGALDVRCQVALM
jgi:hypothetical protein